MDASGSQSKAECYQRLVDSAIDDFSPLITVRRKSTDLPWLNAKARRLIRRRKGIYRSEGRSVAWKALKKKSEALLTERKEKYKESQKICLLAEDTVLHFWKNCKMYQSKDRPKQFDPRTLFPGKSDLEVANILAEHFNAISREFNLLEPSDIPLTFSAPIAELARHEVSACIRHFRKPKSMVRGDIFPKLLTLFSDFLAIPLTSIYNEITRTSIWPAIWKEEYVTVIPKKKTPNSIDCLLYTSPSPRD